MARKTKRTLRKMPSLAREIAKIANEQASLNRRLMNLAEKAIPIEASAQALEKFLVTIPEPAEAQP